MRIYACSYTRTVILPGKKAGAKMWLIGLAGTDAASGKLKIYKQRERQRCVSNQMRRVYQTLITISVNSLVSGDYQCDDSLVVQRDER